MLKEQNVAQEKNDGNVLKDNKVHMEQKEIKGIEVHKDHKVLKHNKVLK